MLNSKNSRCSLDKKNYFCWHNDKDQMFMKKIYLWMVAVMCLMAAPCVTSCSEDNDDEKKENTGGNNTGGNTENPGDNTGQSGNIDKETLTSIEAKALIEAQGMDILNQLTPLQNEKALMALAVLENLLEFDDYVDMIPDSASSVHPPYYSPAASAGSAFWNMIDMTPGRLGTYTYNAKKEEFDFVKGSELVYIYPAAPNTTSNNARLVVTDNTKGEGMPTNLNAVLYIDNNSVMTASAKAAYTAEGMPASANTNVTIGTNYASTTAVDLKKEGLTANSAIKAGNKNIVDVTALLPGFSFSQGMSEASLATINSVDINGKLNEVINIVGTVEKFGEFMGKYQALNKEYNMKEAKYYKEYRDELSKINDPSQEYETQLAALEKERQHLQDQLDAINEQMNYADSAAIDDLNSKAQDLYNKISKIQEEMYNLPPIDWSEYYNQQNQCWARYSEKTDALDYEKEKQTAQLYNDYVKLELKGSKAHIADVEFYADQYEKYSYTESELRSRLLFADGTRIDVEDFFTAKNFPTLTSTIETIIKSLNDRFDF